METEGAERAEESIVPSEGAGSGGDPADSRRRIHLVCELTAGLEFAYVSPGFERDLGHAVDELLGSAFVSIVHPEDVAPLCDRFDVGIASGRPFNVVARIRDRSARWHACSWRVHPYVGRTGEARIALWGIDVHAQRIHESVFGELIAKARDALVVFDAAGRIQLFNPFAEALLGYRADEVLQQTFEIFMPERLRADRDQLWSRFLLEGTDRRQAGPIEVVARKKDGSEIVLAVLVSRVGDEAVRSVIACLRDVEGEAAAAERRKLIAAQQTQARRFEILGKVANGIAHDSNNLLGAIVNLSNLALDSIEADSPARPHLLDVKKATFRIAELCRRLMTFTGKSEPEMAPVDLSAEVGAMRRLLVASVPKSTALRFELAPRVEAIEADATQLNQLLLNLVVNAAESLESGVGEVVVRTGLTPGAEADAGDECLAEGDEAGFVEGMPEGPCAILEVSDTGCGIDPATRERMFEPFFSTKKDRGHGFGMAVVLDIVRAHAGSLRIRSHPGRGTTITVYLPLSARASAKRLRRFGRGPSSRREMGATILLADDEEVLLHSTRGLLEAAGHAVVIARDGAEAVELFAREPGRFDLVILDLAMPGLNGWQAHERIHALRPDVKVLFVSGWPEEVAQRRAVGPSASGFVQKPYEAAALIGKIEQVMASRASASPAAPPAT